MPAENAARRSKEEHRLNMNMSYWAHRKLRMIAAGDMMTMRQVIESAILGFEGTDDAARESLYDQAHELRRDEKVEAQKLQEIASAERDIAKKKK